jgi:hypothetical protein
MKKHLEKTSSKKHITPPLVHNIGSKVIDLLQQSTSHGEWKKNKHITPPLVNNRGYNLIS